MKHVIIGVGAAGISAAGTIRSLHPDDEIVMLSADEHVHSRCMLHKYISGERGEAGLRFVPVDFMAKNNIQWMAGRAVEGVDTAARQVRCAGGGTVDYDRLLIATGAVSAVPPIGQLRTAANVFGLRDLADAQRIKAAAQGAENIVVIGSGLVGLDAAYAFVELGKKPVVVEMADRILALNLDAHAAEAYQRRFEDAGCTFHLGAKVVDTVSEGDRVTAVVLDGERKLPCDLVIVATGVRPAIAFLEGSGIAAERAVTVDETMRTSADGVYAAGDVAGLSGIWPNAVDQGAVAARNMCGGHETYDDRFAIKNTVNFFGLLSLSVGCLEAGEGDRVYVREDRLRYQKVIVRDGRVLGVLLQGDIAGSGFWQYLIKNSIDIRPLGKSVWQLTYADFCDFEPNGEYRWQIPG